MGALLDVRLVDDAEFAGVAVRWLRLACEGLAPRLWAQLQAAVPLGPAREWPHERHGEPGGVWAHAVVVGRPWRGEIDAKVYTPEVLDWLTERLASRPLQVSVELYELNGDGSLGEEDQRMLWVSVRVDEDHPEWVQLRAGGTLQGEDGDLRLASVSDRWAQVLRSMVAEVDVSFGHVADDDMSGGVRGNTGLDTALRRTAFSRSVLESREVLRGYSWVTVCPRELAQRLGGARVLARSGAFSSVEELPHGGLWLQAVKHFTEYDDEAVNRVFHALAPVLPGGMPVPDEVDEFRYRLAWQDAGWYQDSSTLPLPSERGSLGDVGEASVVGGAKGYEIRFDREFECPTNVVWRMVTDPAAVLSWFGWRPPDVDVECAIELRPGGRLVVPYPFPTGRGPRLSRNVLLGVVGTVQAPGLVEYSLPGPDGPAARVALDLAEGPGGRTSISLVQVCQVRDRVPTLLADWRCRLDAIDLLCGGRSPEAAWQRWRVRHDVYRSAIARTV